MSEFTCVAYVGDRKQQKKKHHKNWKIIPLLRVRQNNEC